MHIIKRRTLVEKGKQLGCEQQLDVWYRIAKKAEWKSLEDVKKTYSNADGVTVRGVTYTVFNIAGNRFRLIVKIEYLFQKVFIKHVLTHAEYTKENWKK